VVIRIAANIICFCRRYISWRVTS